MVVQNQEGMDHLLSSQFKSGADASAAAGPVGRDAAADTDIKPRAEVLTYSRARGLFAGIDLKGAAVTQDKDETHLLYGRFVPFSDILGGKVEPPRPASLFWRLSENIRSRAVSALGVQQQVEWNQLRGCGTRLYPTLCIFMAKRHPLPS